MCFAILGLFVFGMLTPSSIGAADISVPELRIITRGQWDDAADSLILSSRGLTELRIAGGYKFGGSMKLGFESGRLDYAGTEAPKEEMYSTTDKYIDALSDYHEYNTTLDFLGAEVVYRDIAGEGSDLTYFLGTYDRFADGDDFIDQFGAVPFGTDYQGYFYFPELNYRGLHRVQGTGLEFSTPFGTG